ncbi:MAG TPA: hypothetical protein VNS09_07465 [Solirubrobacter sp.]|nr:hypothetical protein [Solirubrobacter sp.]
MDARLVTSHHSHTTPQVREIPRPAHAPSPQGDESRRSQRDLVAASLLACPDRSGAGLKR